MISLLKSKLGATADQSLFILALPFYRKTVRDLVRDNAHRIYVVPLDEKPLAHLVTLPACPTT